jgi:NitT/TauT family transport system permease protein
VPATNVSATNVSDVALAADQGQFRDLTELTGVTSVPKRRTGGGSKRRLVVLGGRIALPLVLLLAWEWAANRGSINTFFYSQPSAIFDFLQTSVREAQTWKSLWITFEETIVGFTLATVLGIACGLLFTRVPLLYEITRPFLTAFNSLPRIALAPLFTLWFGLGQASKVALVVSLCFFIVLSATMGAIGNVDPDLVRLARVLGYSPTQVFRKVMLPWAVPGIFAGLEIALVYAFVGAVAAEMIASKAGVGQQIQLYSGTLNTTGVLGTLVLLAAVTTVFALLMERIRRRLMRHQLQ